MGYCSVAIAGWRHLQESEWAFGCLELFACFLRRDAMLMIQPMGDIVFLCLFWVMGGFLADHL